MVLIHIDMHLYNGNEKLKVCLESLRVGGLVWGGGGGGGGGGGVLGLRVVLIVWCADKA
jgi:hypothetical protein